MSGRLIQSLLIANRGEIACRFIHTSRELGVRTFAAYSEADAGPEAVLLADMETQTRDVPGHALEALIAERPAFGVFGM